MDWRHLVVSSTWTSPTINNHANDGSRRSQISFSDYLKWHQSYFSVLLLQITLQCPLECSHCCVSSSPRRSESLRTEDIANAINSFAKLKTSRLVCITGGEPFSYRSGLINALNCCNKEDLYAYVITSANWATSKERARTVLSSVGKIDLLSISTDRFHESFVNIDTVITAVTVAQEMGISTNILFTTDTSDTSFERRFYQEIESRNIEISIHNTPLGPVGRGKDLFKDLNYIRNGIGAHTEPCRLIGALAVTSSGNVSACCQVKETNIIEKTLDHGLAVGHVRDLVFPEQYAQFGSNTLFRAIRTLGPKWIAEVLKRELGQQYNPEQEQSICSICSKFSRHPEVARSVNEILSQPKYMIILERAEEIVSHVAQTI